MPSIIFPRVLDLKISALQSEFQTGFKAVRGKIEALDEQKIKQGEVESEQVKKKSKVDTLKLNKMFKQVRREAEIKQHDDQLWHDLTDRLSNRQLRADRCDHPTHKGRNTSYGHYLGWVHGKGGRYVDREK